MHGQDEKRTIAGCFVEMRIAERESNALLERWRNTKACLAGTGVKLIAVSKYATLDQVKLLAEAGQHAFAESRPQALRDRARDLPDLEWHLIGPVQKNKAKYVGRYAKVWHSLADAETALCVARHVTHSSLKVLIQVNLSGDPSRHGVLPERLPDLVETVQRIPELELIGLMTMVPLDGSARACFRRLRELANDVSLCELSMGMSNDWRIAVEEGATMVRLGRCLFGGRVH